jgi:hypothetical protein
MPECRKKFSPASAFSPVFNLRQSGIGIPASESVRDRLSRISPALPSYDWFKNCNLNHIFNWCALILVMKYETSAKEEKANALIRRNNIRIKTS